MASETTSDALWVFAYGSLLWDVPFVPAEVRPATLHGWRRSFCMWSVHWRGTPASPGLVLALEAAEGASCAALALRVEQGSEEAVLRELRARELVSGAYEERHLPAETGSGTLQVLAYVMRPGHPQHARLDIQGQAAIIARAEGQKGSNLDYLRLTVERLDAAGLPDADLRRLLELAQPE